MNQKLVGYTAILLLMVQFISCSSDDNTKKEIEPDNEPIETLEIKDNNLMAALKSLGYTFEGNAIKIDQKVKDTQELNLSSQQISDLEGIKAFKNLKEINVANNKLDIEFDFAVLPPTLTGIQLQGNELYEFFNLKLLPLNKLYLPESAKFNMEEVLDFYKTNKEAVEKGTVDMQMLVQGELKKYTTQRVIPDPILREYMKETFPSLFPGSSDLLDIATPLRIPENTAEFHLGEYISLNKNKDPNYDETKDPDSYDNTYLYLEETDDKYKTSKIENYEGIQYVLQHRDYGASWVDLNNNHQAKNTSIRYLKVPDNGVTWLWMRNFHIAKGIKISSTSLKRLKLEFMSGFKTLDLSSSADWFVGGALTMSDLVITNCLDLEEIIVPKSKLSDMQWGQIKLLYLPKLQKADFSHINSLWGTSSFRGLPAWNVQFPKILTAVEHKINLSFDQSMLTTHKEKSIELMHKVEASTPNAAFYYCGPNARGKWVNTQKMDKDGTIL